jgi:hypothetical protein
MHIYWITKEREQRLKAHIQPIYNRNHHVYIQYNLHLRLNVRAHARLVGLIQEEGPLLAFLGYHCPYTHTGPAC